MATESGDTQIDGHYYPLGCTVLSCMISFSVIIGHLASYTDPTLQKYIIRILFMIPVYALSSYISITNPEKELYCAAIRDFYEAYVLYTFVQLLIAYMGGPAALLVHFEFKRRI